jgi:hypothetical protein
MGANEKQGCQQNKEKPRFHHVFSFLLGATSGVATAPDAPSSYDNVNHLNSKAGSLASANMRTDTQKCCLMEYLLVIQDVRAPRTPHLARNRQLPGPERPGGAEL